MAHYYNSIRPIIINDRANFFFPVDFVLPVIVRKHRVKVLVLVIELMKRLLLGRANFFSQV